MNYLTLCLMTLAGLTACGKPETDLTLSVTGVVAKDVDAVRAELEKLVGAGKTKVLELNDGTLKLSVRTALSTADLAGLLSKSESGLKNVTGFDAQSATIAFGGAPPPADPPAMQGTVPREVKVEIKKDPLAYKVLQLEGGTIASFDGWKVQPVPAYENWIGAMSCPEGKQDDFQIFVYVGTPGAQILAGLFESAPNLLRQLAPAVRDEGEAKRCTFGGDDARVQDYSLDRAGKKILIQGIVIRKKDVGVCIWGVGTSEGMKQYGRAPEIVAQSITVRESPPDPGLVGNWSLSHYSSSGAGTRDKISVSTSRNISIFPNGCFTDTSFTGANAENERSSTSVYAEGDGRGKILRRGKFLTFQYDSGRTWSVEYELKGGSGLSLGGTIWIKE